MNPVGEPARQAVLRYALVEFRRGAQPTSGLTPSQRSAELLGDLRPSFQNGRESAFASSCTMVGINALSFAMAAAPGLEVCAATWSAIRASFACRADRRASLVHAHSVWVRVDPKQHVALAHRLVVAHVELDDPAADVRRHVNQVGLQIGIVRARPLIDPALSFY